jgi:chromate transporter
MKRTEVLAKSDARPSLAPLLLRFLAIGTIGFGGGMANIALMERELVRKRGWLSSEEFLHGISFGQLLDPFATNTAFFVGAILFGPLEGLLCVAAFLTPSVILVTLFSWLYFTFHSIPALKSSVQGVGPVVIALILAAAWSVTRKAVRRMFAVPIAVLALAANLLRVNAVWVLVGAGAVGLALGRKRLTGGKPESRPPSPPSASVPPGAVSLMALATSMAPTAAVSGGLLSMAWTFLKVGCVFFGGGFVLVPILYQRLVSQLHWLNGREFLDGVAISNLTPGPIAVLATFVGYHLHGVAGGILALAALYAPAMALMAVLSHGYARLSVP